MNKEVILNTAISHFDATEKVYVVESPLFERVIGVARTEKQAWKIFYELLNDAWMAYLEDRLGGYSKRGRPKKDKSVHLHVLVKPTTKEDLAELATLLSVTQGEAIDYVVSLWGAIDSRPDLRNTLLKIRGPRAGYLK